MPLTTKPSGAVASWLARYQLLPVIVLTAIAVVGSVLAVGTVHMKVLLCVAPVAIGAGAWSMGRAGMGPAAIPAPAWLFFLLSGYSALQALPLPPGVVRLLSPATASIWERALLQFGPRVSWLCLSLDPGASIGEALKWCCYGFMFCAGAAIASAQSRRVVPSIVFGSALLAALVALVHHLLSAESLFGVYTPITRPATGIAPLMNSNNFAGYLNLGAFCGLGLSMARRPVAPRWAIALGVSVVLGSSAVLGSRAGLASLTLGMLALVALLWRVKLNASRALVWVPISALCGGMVLFTLAVNAGIWQSMIDEGAKKIALISWTKPVVRDFPAFGIGRGAFESVFPAYRADLGHHVYQFAENFIMQWCVEWGIPVALAACLAFAYTLWRCLRGARSDVLGLCCAVGVLVLLAQNLLDLALEVASVGLALAVLLGSLWARPREGRFETEALQQPQAKIALYGLGVVLWAFTAIAGIHTTSDDRLALASLAQRFFKGDSSVSPALADGLKAAIERHPAEPYFPLMAAALSGGSKGGEMTWISRAIERDPMAGRPYLLLAQALARRNAKTQALAAVRLAVAHDYSLLGGATTVALSMSSQLDDLRSAVPDGSAGAGMLVHLARQPSLLPFREKLLSEAMVHDPRAVEARWVRADDLLESLEGNRAPCESPNQAPCVAEVRRLSASIASLDSRSDRPYLFNARLMLVEGNAAGAQSLLAEKCKLLVAQVECDRLRVLAAERVDDPRILEDATASLLAAACSSPTDCASTAAWLGRELEAHGALAAALHMYERAAHESETPEAWRQVSQVASRLGLSSVAARALKHISGPTTAKDREVTLTLERKRLQDMAILGIDGGEQ